MSTPRLRPLPEAERRASLEQYLAVLDRHENLAHFRTLVRTGPERQLALIAALERAVQIGSPQASPPDLEDQADLLLCEILDCVNNHPELKSHGSAYGADRHLANLQALGIWRGKSPLKQPTAREFFTTSFSHLTADATDTLAPSEPITSPLAQMFDENGELIPLPSDPTNGRAAPTAAPQILEGTVVNASEPGLLPSTGSLQSNGILHHADSTPGEESRPLTPSGPDTQINVDHHQLPTRPLRRGQPRKLDDVAKGRLLGLMSFGLSFRQAAAQLGVHHVTILNTLKRDEPFAQQVSEARLDAISQPLLTVVKASRTNWRTAAWLAKFLSERNQRIYETTPEEYELKKSQSA